MKRTPVLFILLFVLNIFAGNVPSGTVIDNRGLEITTDQYRFTGYSGKKITIPFDLYNPLPRTIQGTVLKVSLPEGWTSTLSETNLPDISSKTREQIILTVLASSSLLSQQENITLRALPKNGPETSRDIQVHAKPKKGFWILIGGSFTTILIAFFAIVFIRLSGKES